ncbi:signal peptidase [filamentous cyanobacterium CCP5]|nr:signal peptidase [filamentous cyanobacterium CCP5]
MPKFDTSLLDQALAEQQERRERERLTTLQQVLAWLDDYAVIYGVDRAYIFGSLVRPGRFGRRSDVDIAVEALEADQFFPAMAALSEAVGRDVDLVELGKCPFAERIRQAGKLWTQPT